MRQPALSGDGHPEFDGGAKAGLALDLVPATRHQGALLERQQAEMPRKVVSLRDHEPFPVVDHQAVNAGIACGYAQPDSRRPGVLLDVREGLGNLAEDGGLELIAEPFWEVELQLGFDSGQGAEHRQPVPWRSASAAFSCRTRPAARPAF